MYIKKFNESYQNNLLDTLKYLQKYFKTDGVFTNKLLDYVFIGNRLVIELDVTSAYSNGKSERDSIKQKLKKVGFQPGGNAVLINYLSEDELKVTKEFFNSLS